MSVGVAAWQICLQDFLVGLQAMNESWFVDPSIISIAKSCVESWLVRNLCDPGCQISTDPRSFPNCSWWHRAEPELCFDHAPLSQLPVCCQVRDGPWFVEEEVCRILIKTGISTILGWLSLWHFKIQLNVFASLSLVSEQLLDCCCLHQPTEISSSYLEVRTSSNLAGLDPSGSSKTKKRTISWNYHQLVCPKAAERVRLGEIPSSSSKDPLLYWWKDPTWNKHVAALSWNRICSKSLELGFHGLYHPTKASKSLGLRICE